MFSVHEALRDARLQSQSSTGVASPDLSDHWPSNRDETQTPTIYTYTK